MKLSEKELIDITIASFKAERSGDLARNLSILHPDFTMTDVVLGDKGRPFIKYSGEPLKDLMQLAFNIKGRDYYFKTIIANTRQQVVMVEFIESYPDPQTGQLFCTPQVAVCEYAEGKLHRTRHYMDPRLSREFIPKEKVLEALS